MMANMKLQLHHINLSTDKVDEMNEFYLNVMKLKTETEGLPVLEKKKRLFWRRGFCIRR